MQATLSFSPTLMIPLRPSKTPSQLTHFPSQLCASFTSHRSSVKATAVTNDTNTVDYNSAFSVFPAEACDTIGGEACWEGMFPEAKLQQKQSGSPAPASESFDREYLEYSEPKTVFRREACDDLGGEFCEHDYQKSVY
ncbi:light-regulated protein 1, chloroplastic [Humulus lupulus]|uniref:light-regulated protein 1, chloroplastic n=1 Tax=Humulus lupulus TaxID=3486 RepID=UPI002B407C6F|nr:light-regulated protein 1, chloroplastic [Humulus lupulus]